MNTTSAFLDVEELMTLRREVEGSGVSLRRLAAAIGLDASDLGRRLRGDRGFRRNIAERTREQLRLWATGGAR